jgi:predicted nucleotidyltransferase
MEFPMLGILRERKADLAKACTLFGVERLAVFGSAAAGSFDERSSDIDFLVSFKPEARVRAFDNFFGLKERLEEICGRPVDLVTERSVKNQHLRREIERHLQPIYVA